MPESFQPPFQGRLACVIFDIDGTLARSNDLVFASFNHVARKYLQKELTHHEIIALFGPPEEGGLARILDPHLVGDAMDDLCSFYEREHAALVSLHEGVAGVLEFLAGKGVRLAVFTGKGRRTTAITLEQLGIRKYFELVISGSDVGKHKPDPEGIQRILVGFRARPEQTLMVGDSLSDIRASHAAGVPVASVLWDCLDRQSVLIANPDFRFERVGDLSAWLRSQLTS